MITTSPKATMTLTKVAWIRNDAPAGQPAPGHLGCPCGKAPETEFDTSAGNIACQCGTVYTWDGWIISRPAPAQ